VAVAPAQAWTFAAVAGLSLVLAAIGPGYAGVLDRRAGAIDLAAVPAPGVASGWRAATVDAPWKPVVLDPDREYLQGFDGAGGRVIRYVALYAVGGVHDNLGRGYNDIADFDKWRLVSRGEARARVDGKDVTVGTTTIAGYGRRLLVWDFYVVGNAIYAGRAEAKLAQLRNLIGHQNRVVAFVAVATDEPDTGTAAAVLARFLEAAAPIEPYLQNLAAAAPAPRG